MVRKFGYCAVLLLSIGSSWLHAQATSTDGISVFPLTPDLGYDISIGISYGRSILFQDQPVVTEDGSNITITLSDTGWDYAPSPMQYRMVSLSPTKPGKYHLDVVTKIPDEATIRKFGSADFEVYGGGDPSFRIGAGVTGEWYNPAQSGHGFTVEILPGNRIVANWFVFDIVRQRTWIHAEGTYEGDTANLRGYQITGEGAVFPPNFDRSKVQTVNWGEFVLKFESCTQAQISWSTNRPEFVANGQLSLRRLTVPLGINCI